MLHFGNYAEWKHYTAYGDSHFVLNSSCEKLSICEKSRLGHPEARGALKPGTSYVEWKY